jgi:hypothetical protein
MALLLIGLVIIVGLMLLACRADARRERRHPHLSSAPLKRQSDLPGGRFRRLLAWLRRLLAEEADRYRRSSSGGGFTGAGGFGGGGDGGYGGSGGASYAALPSSGNHQWDSIGHEDFQLCAVCDVEARRWQNYAELWGTHQYDDGPWTSTVVEYVALAYMVVSAPVRVWIVLVDLGVVD